MIELLIIKPSSLGDIVQALQVATSLKAQLPRLRISWVVREIFAPIVRACEAVDHVYVFERNAGAKGFLRLTKEIRKKKFDYVFDMQGLLRTGLMTSRVLAAKKIGRADAREWSGVFYDEKVPLPPAGKRSHALEILLHHAPIQIIEERFDVLGTEPPVVQPVGVLIGRDGPAVDRNDEE